MIKLNLMTRTAPGDQNSDDTTLTEGKFLRGLETSIEVLDTNLSKHSD